MTQIYFCNIPFLSIDYSNVVDFESTVQRETFFKSFTNLSIEGNVKADGEQTTINVNIPSEELINYDYCFLYDNKNKPFFYFITNVIKETTRNSTVMLKLDVWSTYFFDIDIKPSFVEKCHVKRWNNGLPTYNNNEEGLYKGEIKQISSSKLANLNKSLVIAASVPMGYVPNFNPVGGGDLPSEDDDEYDTSLYGGDGSMWKNGVISSKCFRFQKGCEGYAPYAYTDSGGVRTIGYGVTQYAGEAFNKLVSNAPCSEEMCAKVFFETCNNNYGKPIVDTCIKLGVTKQCQFDALCCLAYNSGTGSVTSSNSLMNAISADINNESAIRSAWEKFKIRDKKGNILSGLIWRRKQECNMFFGQDVEMRAISKVGTGGVVTENNGNGWLPKDSTDEEGGLDGYKSVSNDAGDNWLVPVKGASLTSPYGWRIHPTLGTKQFHSGVDLACPQGTPIIATKSGEIVETGYSATMGNYVRHNTGSYQVIYMHLHKIECSKGEIKRGARIGQVGTTGRSTGNHLHWQIQTISGKETVNPLPNNKKGDVIK